MAIITLTTDFGTQDWFVGTMKGVILGIDPKAVIVDLTHEIPPGNIRAGAFALAAAFRYFPQGTVHLGVVDPGVGSARRAVAVRTRDYFFVAPDNGILSWALAQQEVFAIRALENKRYFLPAISHTFHGRDVFAPAAAHLSRGLPLGRLGPAIEDIIERKWPEPGLSGRGLQGEVIYVDRFGNAITNMEAAAIAKLPGKGVAVFRGRQRLCCVRKFYQAVPPGQAVAVLGSSGFLEIAVNAGRAAEKLKLRVGTRVRLVGSAKP